eukprot:m.195800 g.195800  ORF g.195800 m.195800 type:complete len:87 (+) comp32586_c0_seq3:129-389(+)
MLCQSRLSDLYVCAYMYVLCMYAYVKACCVCLYDMKPTLHVENFELETIRSVWEDWLWCDGGDGSGGGGGGGGYSDGGGGGVNPIT